MNVNNLIFVFISFIFFSNTFLDKLQQQAVSINRLLLLKHIFLHFNLFLFYANITLTLKKLTVLFKYCRR